MGVSHRDVPGASRVAFLREEDRVDELARLRGEVRCAARESHEGVLLAHLCDLLGEGREQVEVLGRLGLARGDHVAEEAFALLQRARATARDSPLDVLLDALKGLGRLGQARGGARR